MNDKKLTRLRRCKRIRASLKRLEANRLSVHRSSNHIYAQVISPAGGMILASASTVEPTVKQKLSSGTSNCEAAKIVGRVVAERALANGVLKVGFDRSGFQYHGRVKALADAARLAGLQF